MYHGKFMCLCLVLLCKIITETYLYCSVSGIDRDTIISKEVALLHHQFWRAKTTDVEDCARICVKRKLCKSFNFDTSTRQCELNDDVYSTGKEIRSGENLIYSNIAQWPAKLEPNCFHRPCGYDEICIPGHLTGNAECSYTCLKLVPTSTQLPSAHHVVSTPAQSNPATSSTSQETTKGSPTTSTPVEGVDPQSYRNVTLANETETNKTSLACGDLPIVLNGRFVIDREVASIKCDDGFDPVGDGTITCLTTGEWSSTTVICKSFPFAGEKFVTVFPRVATDGQENVLYRQIFITSYGQARVWITSKFQNLSRTVEMDRFTVQNFSSSYTLTDDHATNNKVIEIQADSPINVHTLTYKNGINSIACDSFYNLPRNRLTKEYILITTDLTPQFFVVGTENDTYVEVKLKNHDSSFFTIELNMYEVFSRFVENRVNSFNDYDLTGSIITSNKAVAVISGGFFAQIPYGSRLSYDMSAVQLPGVSDWSSSCIMAPFIPRIGFEYKIVASENDTSVDVITSNNVTTVNLNRAEKITRLHNAASPVLVNATKPILVAMFSFGQVRKSDKEGDSSMILCQYLELYLNNYAFFAPAYFNNHVRIIIQDSYKSYLRLNNMPLTPFYWLNITTPTGIKYAIIYIMVDEMKYYTLESTNGAKFGADMYGLERSIQYSQRLG